MKCVGCWKKIRWYHRTGANTSWHLQCWISWEKGYDVSYKHCEEMNNRVSLPSPNEIYWATQISSPPSLTERIMEKIRRAVK